METNCVPECLMYNQSITNAHLMNQNDQPLKTVSRIMYIGVPINNCTVIRQCYIDIDKVLELFKFDDSPALAIIDFYCLDKTIIHLTRFNGTQLANVISYIQINNCSFSMESYEVLGNVIYPFSLLLRNAGIPSNYTVIENTGNRSNICNTLDQVATLWIHNTLNAVNPLTFQNILDLFQCSLEFPNLKDLTINNVHLNFSLFDISKKFPNIVSLELTSIGLTQPISFPWKVPSISFPRKLSSSELTLNHYAKAFHITVEKHHIRKLLNLNMNKIGTLGNYTIHGDLQIIQFSGNKIQDISENLFRNVDGLEHIDLSLNKIERLPLTVFGGLYSLKHFDIHSNKLKEIQEDLFLDNRQLIYLDMSSNNIEKIDKNAFQFLNDLQEIHLEYNRIVSVDTLEWPIYSTKLQSLYFDRNPITQLPTFIFYLSDLQIASFKNTLIQFKNFTTYISNISYSIMADQILNGVDKKDDLNTKEIIDNPGIVLAYIEDKKRVIDLTGCKINHIELIYYGSDRYNYNSNHVIRVKLIFILKYYRLILEGNPINCDCRIIHLNRFIAQSKKFEYLDSDKSFLSDWKCQEPLDMKGREMITIPASETYCEKLTDKCPSNCTCYTRAFTSITIVDCRNRHFVFLPKLLPDGILDLWFQNNNITTISLGNRKYFPRIRQLFLSENQIVSINDDALMNMKNLDTLLLDSNYLVSLPRVLERMQIRNIKIMNNPFKCDCHTKWMKHWMLQRRGSIEQVSDVTCNVDDEDEKGKFFISVYDEEFVCLEDFDSTKHVVIPSITCSIVLVLLIIFLSLIYVYRLEVKVLMYIYLGIHPFDKDDKDRKEVIDVLVLHAADTTDWVMENIVQYLEFHKNYYVVCEMMRDFVAGFTYLENIASIVKHSKRMLIVLSTEFIDDDLLKVAWNEAQEKIKELRTNYAIVVCYDVTLKEIMIKDMQRYIKRGRYIDAKQALFHEKLLYSMPQYKDIDNKNKSLPDIKHFIQETYGEDGFDDDVYKKHAFVSYPDCEMPYIMNELRPTLEDNGYLLCLPDRDFLPGASKEENVLKAIDFSLHTLFILSGNHLQDEWSVFTFRIASEKSLRVRSNHLIVVIGQDADLDTMDDEVRFYIKTHVTLRVDDKLFFKKLLNSLPDVEARLPNIIEDIANGRQRYPQNGIERHYDEDDDHDEVEEVNGRIGRDHAQKQQTIVAEINYREANGHVANRHIGNGTIQLDNAAYVHEEDVHVDLDREEEEDEV